MSGDHTKMSHELRKINSGPLEDHKQFDDDHVEHIPDVFTGNAKRDGDDAAAALEGQDITYTPDEERALRRKQDLILIPMLAFGVGLLLVDKTALGSAATLTLQNDLGLVGSQYSWAVSIYFFGLLTGTYPATYLEQKFHTGRVVGIAFICWGAIMFATMAIKDYRGLFVTRYLLGLFESAASPGFTAITARFYTPDEQPIRYSMWAVGNTVLPIPFLCIYYAIGGVPSEPLQPWRWIFCVTGATTLIIGTIIIFFLPDSPSNCSWLSPRERAIAVARIAKAQTGIKSHVYKKWQIIEALTDVKVWIIAFMLVCQQPAPGIAVSFSGIIIKGYGFTGIRSLLLQIPAWLVPCVITPLSGYLITTRPLLKRRKTMVIVLISAIALISEAVLFTNPPLPGANQVVPLIFLSLLSIDQSIYPIILTLLGQNIAGGTQKQTAITLTWLMYCVENIAVPQSFLASEAPRYQTGLAVTMSAQAALICLALIFFFICTIENRRRDKLDAANVVTAETSPRELVMAGLADETDKRNKRFRYMP